MKTVEEIKSEVQGREGYEEKNMAHHKTQQAKGVTGADEMYAYHEGRRDACRWVLEQLDPAAGPRKVTPEQLEKARGASELVTRSFMVALPYPEIGEVMTTAFGDYVVIIHGYGGEGWVRTVPIEHVV